MLGKPPDLHLLKTKQGAGKEGALLHVAVHYGSLPATGYGWVRPAIYGRAWVRTANDGRLRATGRGSCHARPSQLQI